MATSGVSVSFRSPQKFFEILENVLKCPGNFRIKCRKGTRNIFHMYFGIILSITLILTISAQCPDTITCRCGTSELYYTHCIKGTLEENACDKWMNCETCEDNTAHCLTCPEGYSGPTCIEDPIANCSDPGLIAFGYRRLINGGRSKSNRVYTFGQSFLYFCNQGYELVGNNVLTCLSSGKWTSLTPSCQRPSTVTVAVWQVFCRYPGQKPNSRLISSTSRDENFPPRSQLRYACNKGFDTKDSLLLTCSSAGEWSSPAPTCTREAKESSVPQSFCTYPDIDETGMIVRGNVDKKQLFLPGSSIEFDCEDDYEIVGDDWIIYCKLNGKWTPNPPVCKLLSTFEDEPEPEIPVYVCPNPTVDPNGAMEDIPPNDPRRIGEMFDAGSPVNFICNEGYEMVGSSRIICLLNGEWNFPPPTCRSIPLPVSSVTSELAQCLDPGAIPNGGVLVFYSIARVNRTASDIPPITYPVGTRLIYDCVKGFSMQGARQLNCRTNGQWSGEKPICAAAPHPPGNFQVKKSTIAIGTTVEVEWTQPRPTEGAIIDYTVRWVNLGTNVTHSISTNETTYLITELEPSSVYSIQVRASTAAGFGKWTDPLVIQTQVECGDSSIHSSPPVSHGTKATPEEFPWTVAIATNEKGFARFLCSGTLVDSQTVLTVAHCVNVFSQYRLFFGTFNFVNGSIDNQGEERQSCEIFDHSGFNKRTFDNDIALITFEPPILFTERIHPICLPTPESSGRNLVPNEMGFVSGWELTTRAPLSEELQMIQIPVVSEQTCREAHKKKRVSLTITPGMFCAGLRQGIPNFCSMASGSPMVFYNAEEDRYTLEGLVSWAASSPCQKKENYITMTRVATFMQWILEILSKEQVCGGR